MASWLKDVAALWTEDMVAMSLVVIVQKEEIINYGQWRKPNRILVKEEFGSRIVMTKATVATPTNCGGGGVVHVEVEAEAVGEELGLGIRIGKL